MRDEFTLLGTMDEKYNISFTDSHRLGRILNRFVGIDKPLEITVSIHRRQRSLAQNRWIWGVCVPTVKGWLLDTKGEKYTADEVYYYINSILGRKPVFTEIAGEEVIIMEGKRFSQMNTAEFADAVEEIVRYFDERDLEILLPKPKTNNLVSDYLNDE